MPQGSLMTWLNKPSSVKQPVTKDDVKAKAVPGETVPPTQAPGSAIDVHLTKSQASPQNNAVSDTSTTSLLPNISFHPPCEEDLPALKRLNQTLLPIPYPQSYYREIISDPVTHHLTLLAFWNDNPVTTAIKGSNDKGTLVGAIRCRVLEPQRFSPPNEQPRKDAPTILYVSTLAVLAPYRGHGIAAEMLKVMETRGAKHYDCGSIGAHVWEANEEALRWYERRGFAVKGKEEGYYRRLKPMTAVVVQRIL